MTARASTEQARPTPRVGRERLLLLAAVLVGLVPALDRPFHVDDDVYLWGARQILDDPAAPLGGTGTFIGKSGPLYHFTQHPPLLAYYQAAVIVVAGGEHERALHVAYAVFPAGVALALHALARRFTALPLPATLLVLATPAFVVMSQGLMTDLPFLALWLGATLGAVRGVDTGRPGPLVASGVLAAFATFVQYRGALLLPLLLVYPLLQRRPWRPLLLALLPTPVLLAAWGVSTWLTLGVAHFFDAGSWIPFEARRLAFDAAAYVALLGGTTVFGPALLLTAIGARLHPAGWTGLALATVAAGTAFTGEYTWPQRAAFAGFVACGGAALLAAAPHLAALPRALAASAEARDRDDAFLLCMAAVPLASQVTLNLFASARSLLLALPFFVLLLLRGLERNRPAASLRRALWATTALTLLTSAGLATADQRFATAQREVAARAAALRPVGARGWFTGEWGFRHYMERAGFTALTSDGAGIAEGDLIVVPEVPCPAPLAPDLEARLRPLAVLDAQTSFPVKMMSFRARAGFYSNFHGLLPWAFSSAPLESARVFAVGPAAPAAGS